MKFAYKNQIMKGISENLIDPLQNTTREQAIVLLKRTYTNFSDKEIIIDNTGMISTFKPSSLLFVSELSKFRDMPENTLFFPKYDERITLYAASTSTKPASKPSSSSLYFKPIFDTGIINLSVNKTIYSSSSFEVWTPTLSATGYFSGETLDLPVFRSVFRVDPRSNENRFFHFNGIDSSYDKIILQIATKPFPTTGGGWPDTPDIIYEQEHKLPITTIYTNYPNSIYLDFTKFAKAASEMTAGNYIKYYLRGVAIKKSANPGLYDVHYSKPVTIEYGYNPPITWYSDSPYKSVETLKLSLPDIKIKNYTPIKWPDKNYMHYYYVFTAPKASDITCKWRNIDTGEILYPYELYKSYYAQKGINTAEEYEEKMIPRVLKEGTKVYFPGTFDLRVTFEMDYYNKIDPIYPLHLSSPSNYAYYSGAGITNSVQYREHFEYGLNNYSVNYAQGGRAIYDVFNPQKGIKVPRLAPNEKTTVRVYLNPYDGNKFSNYPEGENVYSVDFENIYFHNGNKKFTYFQLTGRFPTAEEYLKEGGTVFYLDPTIQYVFTKEAYQQANEKIQRSVSSSWTK
jgi:hypothetical protein